MVERLYEGEFNNLGFEGFLANDNGEDVANGCHLFGHITGADTHLHAGRHGTRNDVANGVIHGQA